jgi:glycine/D-amino acid oxidase-like deaminating enzyme
LEPELRVSNWLATRGAVPYTALYLKERCVDPRDLTLAAVAAARHRGIDLSIGDHVVALELTNGDVSGVRTNKTRFASGTVVNCAGAWAGQIEPNTFPTRPVKGQMLSVLMPQKELIRHVIRTPDVYLIPRTDGRMLIGATVEEAGFDKRTVPETIQKLRQAALDLVPELENARILEAWAGLRPGTPDGLPILGPTSTPGYFIATGHFRDGILLSAITAKLMAQIMVGQEPALSISSFSPERFVAQDPCAMAV